MTLKHDPQLPFAVIGETTKSLYARFASQDMAQLFARAQTRLEVVDTTPRPLPSAAGSVIHIKGSMPLVRVANGWIMPMNTIPDVEQRTARLARPGYSDGCHLTDDDAREILARYPASAITISDAK